MGLVESDLADSVARIHDHVREAVKDAQNAVQHALEAGRLLVEEKKRHHHGEWLPWLKANVPEISQQTASNWMRIAANYQRAGDLPRSQRAALLAIAPPLSPDQVKQAVNVGNVPEQEFEQRIESDSPPSVFQLANEGKKGAARPRRRDPVAELMVEAVELSRLSLGKLQKAKKTALKRKSPGSIWIELENEWNAQRREGSEACSLIMAGTFRDYGEAFRYTLARTIAEMRIQVVTLPGPLRAGADSLVKVMAEFGLKFDLAVDAYNLRRPGRSPDRSRW